MDTNIIKEFPDELKRRLIDYIVDLPSDVASFIKMEINDPKMDPSLWKSRHRVLSPYATIGKYLSDKCDIETTDQPIMSYYQSRYSSVMKKIDNLNSSYPLISSKSSSLRSIMNIPCYDLESLTYIERAISELLSSSSDIRNDALCDLAAFITDEIIPYKLDALAVNQDLLFNMLGFDITGTYPFINAHRAMVYAVRDMGDSYTTMQNIAILIYTYFVQLEINGSVFNKYNLFKRFELFIAPFIKDTDTVREMVTNFFNDNINLSNVL